MADYTHTLARAQMSQLSLEEQARGFSHKFTINYTDVNSGTVSTDTDTVTLGTLPSWYYVDKAALVVTTAFAGTVGALGAVVGTTTTTNAFVTSQSVLTVAALPGAVSSTAPVTATASKNIVAVFTVTTSGSATTLTAGSADLYLNIINMGAPNKLG